VIGQSGERRTRVNGLCGYDYEYRRDGEVLIGWGKSRVAVHWDTIWLSRLLGFWGFV
jgi:hypothetical protein